MFVPESVNYQMDFARRVVGQREGMKKDNPDDVIGILMKVRDRELTVKTEEGEYDLTKGGKISTENFMTTEIITTSIVQFFLDGVDTIAANVSMACYFLAHNPEV